MKLASANTLCALMEQRDNMSMGTLARYAGCSKGFISHLTSGRRSTCTPQLAERIAEALNVPVTVLFMPGKSADDGQSAQDEGARMSLSPAERTLRAKLAAHTRWSREDDRMAATAAMRAGSIARFEKQVDPDGTLAPAERAIRAEHARRAHMSRLSMLAAKKRREQASA